LRERDIAVESISSSSDRSSVNGIWTEKGLLLSILSLKEK
jgi:hypothetical protein